MVRLRVPAQGGRSRVHGRGRTVISVVKWMCVKINLLLILMVAFLATSCGDEKNNVNTGWEYEVGTLYDLEVTSLDGEKLGTIKRDTKTFCFF